MLKKINSKLLYYLATTMRGEMVHKYINEYNKFQCKNNYDIEQYQLHQLKRLLAHAERHVIFYQNHYKNSKPLLAKLNSLDDLHAIPLITKLDIIDNWKTMQSDVVYLFNSKKTTGGSTGNPVTITKNANALARERAATWRSYKWANVRVGDMQARFWGEPITKKSKFTNKLADYFSNRIRLSAFNLDEKSFKKYFITIHKHNVDYLYGYASMIYEFALYCDENNLKLPTSVKSIITTSEILSQEMKEAIEKTFDLKVFNEYGCGEVGSIAHECEYGKMHIMSDNIIVEILDEEGNKADVGEIVITDLFNYAMPLIRYKVGDFGKVSQEGCQCGRTLPILKNIHGRAYDMIVTEGGKRFHPELLLYVFEEISRKCGGVRQFQVIQSGINMLEVKIVKNASYCKDVEDEIRQLIHAKLHASFSISYDYVERIEREPSGKLRLVKSLINNSIVAVNN